MAPKKKKFSAKQIAAQKKFAAAAKAGTLRKGSKLKSKSGGSKKGKIGGNKGGRKVAKKKRTKSKQGVVSWAVNLLTLGIASSNVLTRISEAWGRADGLEWFARTMLSDHAGLIMGPGMTYEGFEAKRMIRGYAPMAGAYAFKTGMGVVLKKVKIQSLIPGR